MPMWRNWQTRWTQNPLILSVVWVRLPPSAPELNFQEFFRLIQPREARQRTETDGQKNQDIINNTELSIIVCEGKKQLKREIFRRINTLGVPLSPYEVLNGLFHGEYLRGLTVYVGQDRGALKVLNANSRGKNQYRILQLLMELKNLPKDAHSINDYVNSNQEKAFADDQKEIGKYIKFVREIFDDYGQLEYLFQFGEKIFQRLGYM